MSIVAGIRALIEQGFTVEQALAAAEAFEAATAHPAKTARQERNARYYHARKARLNASETVLNKTIKTDSDACKTHGDDAPQMSPTPPKINSPTGSNIYNPPSAPPETAPRKASRATKRVQIAEDAQPTVADHEAAMASGLSPEEFRDEWRAFRDHHRSRANVMADWRAAWRTWLRNRKRFARAGPTGRPHETILTRLAFGAADHEPDHDTPRDCSGLATVPAVPRLVRPDSDPFEPSGADGGRTLASFGLTRSLRG